VPFSLTERFRPLLQRGIELSNLDVTYVTSLSWYFLVMFGLSGAISLVLGEGHAADDTKMMLEGGIGMAGMGQPGQQPDMIKVYTNERENIELVNHDWAIQGAEERLLFRHGLLRVADKNGSSAFPSPSSAALKGVRQRVKISKEVPPVVVSEKDKKGKNKHQ